MYEVDIIRTYCFPPKIMAIINIPLLPLFASDFGGLALLPPLYTPFNQGNAPNLPQNVVMFIGNTALGSYAVL